MKIELSNTRFFRDSLFWLFIILLSSLTHIRVIAQRGDCPEISNIEAIKLYQEALGKPTYKLKEALNLLEKACLIQPNFVDAYYKYGELCYNHVYKMFDDTSVFISGHDNYFVLAEKNFLKVVELCPSFNYYNAYFFLGQFNYHLKKFKVAGNYLKIFILHNSESAKYYTEAKQMLKNADLYLSMINNPVPFHPQPLLNVCTSNDEYLPLISPDEEMLFFSRRFKKNPNTAFEEYVEQLVVSNRLYPDSSQLIFSSGVPMDEPFNDGRNQGGATITIDNNHLFITICEFERADYTSYKNCDIFSSDNVKGKWTPLKRLGKEINNINTFEGMPTITADGKILFFVSAREGGYGGMDIYKSEKEKDGSWGKAWNLGPVINTPGDDKTPFIHSDSQTLYFSTNGRFGLGGFDVFYSQYYGNGQWSEPKNMGYPINTGNDEVGLIVSTNGKQIFLSSREFNKDGNWDIYSAGLYDAARPKKVLFVKGKLTDENDKEVPNAHVGLTSMVTKEFTEGLVDENSGKYAVAVPVKKDEDFMLTVKKDEYFFNSKHIDPEDAKYDPPTTVNLKISQMEKNKPIRLENVNFEIDSYTLDDISKANINLLIEFMKVNPDIKIVLQGHTDNQGSPHYNDALSKNRVKEVRDYMCSQGISSGRVSYKGFGERKPLAENSTKKGRALNRRVEFIIK
jgi:outer membrane protein OmpA-like peptidoglycan-associated protein/tetratricopeptide (TPR) repeat protein